MIKRTIEISGGPTRLSVDHRQLVIERRDQPRATVPCEDIGLLLIDTPAATYTHSVFTVLAEHGAAVVFCGAGHLPAAMVLPIAGNTVQTERFRAQLEVGAPLKKQLWRQTVAAKLRRQGEVLRALTGSDAGLPQIARKVRSDDSGNEEAKGAARYWPRLFGTDFRRRRYDLPPNNSLNYGYMALRAATARALVGAGLLPTVGIHHRNRYNAFCLASDLMEPYRPYVDFEVAQMHRAGMCTLTLERDHKARLLGVFNQTVTIGARRTPLMLALQATASSLQSSFAARRARLLMPAGVAIQTSSPDPGEEAADGEAEI